MIAAPQQPLDRQIQRPRTIQSEHDLVRTLSPDQPRQAMPRINQNLPRLQRLPDRLPIHAFALVKLLPQPDNFL